MITLPNLNLLIQWEDVKPYSAEIDAAIMVDYTEDQQDAVMDSVKNYMQTKRDVDTPGDHHFEFFGVIKEAQIYLTLHIVVLSDDNSAGTGSLAGVNVDGLSASNTMAANNAEPKDWLRLTQYGKRYAHLAYRNPKMYYRVC